MIPASIPRQLSGQIEQDFFRLRDEALNWLARWCAAPPAAGPADAAGKEWSDFNVHDPGVQITEVICHALTELAYRARVPVGVVLQNERGKIQWEEGAMFAPPDILPMNPLTAADYRKLLLDRFHQIYQVWLQPDVNGHHWIWLFLHAIPAAEREQVRQSAQELLEQQRNLGEHFTVLTAPDITLSGELVPPSSQLEKLYEAAQQVITTQPSFVTIVARKQAGHSLSDILTGPLLQHGTLADESLSPLPDWDQAQAHILAALSQITGTTTHGVSFGCTLPLNPLQAPPPPAPGALHGPFQPCGVSTLTPGAFTTTEPTDANLHFQSMGYPPPPPSRKLLRNPGWMMPVPEPTWQRKDLPEFHPLQQSFPPNYGLGPDELPLAATPLRRAQVQQLRGYLLHFEQMMRNYLAQLVHLPSLFSVRPQQQTYFAQTVYAVPEVMPLLKGFNSEGLNLSPSATLSLEAAYRRNRVNPYRRQLVEAGESPQEFARRRHRFLDHLLARFGESFGLAEGATYETAHNKELLLRHLPELGRRRATAAEIGRGAGRTCLSSGLEEKIRHLLQRDRAGPDEPKHTPFYYLVENGLLASAEHDDGAFELTHVLVNWTGNSLNPPFEQYVEALIEEHSGAHLCHVFRWFDPGERAEDAACFRGFLANYKAWRRTRLNPAAAAKATVSARMKAQAATDGLKSWLKQPQPLPTPVAAP
ncbi:MAG: hypothetical protein B7Z37_01955 [Verrucomicrobia bacterium 12-59-8]|nr:MAG: hypothetical protein B7Z37_01955 [Verrucomicrobia bacterium 12-59-8]